MRECIYYTFKISVKKSSVPDIPPTPRTLISENQQAEKAQERPQTSDDKSKKSTAKLRSDKKSDTQSNPATVNMLIYSV